MKKNRPTSVAVIGWIWIIMSINLWLVGGMAFAMAAFYVEIGKHIRDMPHLESGTMEIGYSFFAIALLSFIAAINFLRLKSWARHILEGLSWLSLIVPPLFLWWEWTSYSSQDVIGKIVDVFVTSIFIVAIILMLKCLRGDLVRKAVAGTTELEDSPNS